MPITCTIRKQYIRSLFFPSSRPPRKCLLLFLGRQYLARLHLQLKPSLRAKAAASSKAGLRSVGRSVGPSVGPNNPRAREGFESPFLHFGEDERKKMRKESCFFCLSCYTKVRLIAKSAMQCRNHLGSANKAAKGPYVLFRPTIKQAELSWALATEEKKMSLKRNTQSNKKTFERFYCHSRCTNGKKKYSKR